MGRILFITDLDSTMIYSHRHDIGTEKVLAEMLDGRQQSFMTQKTFDFFSSQHWFDTVPLTTRNHLQYSRLSDLADKLGWKRAMICNGAVLLENGMENAEWRKDSERIAEQSISALTEMMKLSERIAGSSRIVYSEPFMFYVKADEPEKLFSELSLAADSEKIMVYRDLRKIYCIPSGFGKDKSAVRYMKQFGYEKYIAAGDSLFDAAMLSEADICFCPESISENIRANGRKYVCSGIFSDSICDELYKLKERGEIV